MDFGNYKVVLFGAGKNGRRSYTALLDNGIEVAYFVDNNPSLTSLMFLSDTSERVVPVVPPSALFNENKTNLKIIITPFEPEYSQMAAQLKDMELEPYNPKDFLACPGLLGMIFFQDKIAFCCPAINNSNSDIPYFPYMDTPKETIASIMEKRDTIIDELNGVAKLELAKRCAHCSALRQYPFWMRERGKFNVIDIGIGPSPCQAKCVYCDVYCSPKHTFELASKSDNPRKVAEIIRYMSEHGFIDQNCFAQCFPGEITILPYKDLILDAISNYKAVFGTNAIRFEQKIADMMKHTESFINVSIDSGTRETYKRVKGVDAFDTVVANLIKYREYGTIELKYIVIPGINDGPEDISGIIEILKTLNLEKLFLSYDIHMPPRAAFPSMIEFIKALADNCLQFKNGIFLDSAWEDITSLIAEHYPPELQQYYRKLSRQLKHSYESCYHDDYKAYRHHVYSCEICELIKNFNINTRFALLGEPKIKHIVHIFEEMEIPLLTGGTTLNESYELLKDSADVLIVYDKECFADVKQYVEDSGGNTKRLLNLESYFYTFESPRLFLEKNMSADLIAHAKISPTKH